MKNLKRVTITGADDSTDIQQLMDLSAEFPFVEWGILVSRKQEGSFRFPSRAWIDRFVQASAASPTAINISTHVCGSWVRLLLEGNLDWNGLPPSVHVGKRIQINTHAEPHVSMLRMAKNLIQMPNREFIFQWDGVNDHLAYSMIPYVKEFITILFDTSGGAGILPKIWPYPPKEFSWCGYAGGLGPFNVVEEVEKINKICLRHYWIDMERRVRTKDDSALDMLAVRSVLTQVTPYVQSAWTK